MKCPLCKVKVGELVDMAESRTRGRLACTTRECPAIVLLTDAGLEIERPPLPKQPSPFREVEHGGALHTKVCGRPACTTTFAGQAKYCGDDCRRAAIADQREERNAARRLTHLRVCALEGCGVEFTAITNHQMYHEIWCRDEAHRRRQRATWAAKQAAFSLSGVGAPAGAGTP